MTREKSSSNFPAMGDGMAQVDDVSAASAAPYQTQRYRPRPERRLPPLHHRAPVQIDAVTGQELTDRMDAGLVRAAKRAPQVVTVPPLLDPWQRRAERRAAHLAAVSAWASDAPPPAHLGGGVSLRSSTTVIEHLFGVGS